MKIHKIIIAIFLSFVIWSCSEKKEDGCFPGDDGSSEEVQPDVPKEPTVTLAFTDTLVSVLKNVGEIEIPLVLSEKVNEDVRVEVKITDVKGGVLGTDFLVPDDMAVINQDSLKGMVRVILADDGKIEDDWSFTIELSQVEGNPAPARIGEAIRCHVQVISNSFVAFKKIEQNVSEKANLTDALEIPLIVVGELKSPVTVKVGPRSVQLANAAEAGIDFEIETPEITLEAGATTGIVRVRTLNNHVVSGTLIGELEIKEVSGGNTVVGKAQQNCRLFIEDDNYNIRLDDASVIKNEYDGHLEVSLSTERPVGEDMNVSIVALDGTAIAGTHFSLDNAGVVSIPAGESSATLAVSLIPDRIVADTRVFQLKLETSDDEWAVIAPGLCEVSLTNGDLPEWDEAITYSFEEASGKQSIQIRVKKAPECDMRLTFANDKLYNLSQEVIFPKGEISHNFDIEVLSDSLNEPAPFNIRVVKVNDLTIQTPVKVAEVDLLAGAYRKLLGNWTMNANNPDNCKATTDATITRVAWQKEVKVVLNSFWNNENIYFNMTFDKVTKKPRIILNKQCESHSWNFGNIPNVILRLLVDGQLGLSDIEVAEYDVEEGIITLPKDKHIGGGGCPNNNLTGQPTVWGFFWKNGTLVKK